MNNLSFINISKFIAMVVVLLYLCTYVYAFKKMDTFLGFYKGELEFDRYMQNILVSFGSSFLCAIIVLKVIMGKKRIIASIYSLLLIFFQGMYLGVFNTDIVIMFQLEYRDWFIYNEPMNCRIRLNEYLQYADYFSNGMAIDCCERALAMISIIWVFNVIMLFFIMVSVLEYIVIGIVRAKKCKIPKENTDVFENKPNSITVTFIRSINYIVAIGLFSLLFKYVNKNAHFIDEEKILNNIFDINLDSMSIYFWEESIWALKFVGLPMAILLVTFVNYIIKKEWYLITTIIYILVSVSVNNVVYIFYEGRLYDIGFSEKIEKYVFCINLYIIILILCTIWKYFKESLQEIWQKRVLIKWEKLKNH